MPLIQITSGRSYPAEMKRQLLQEITRVTHEVTGTPLAGIRVWIVEVPENDLMIAGQTMAEIVATSHDSEVRESDSEH